MDGPSAKALDAILATGANINIYMLHGGTSFGFDNGANLIPGLAVWPCYFVTKNCSDTPHSEKKMFLRPGKTFKNSRLKAETLQNIFLQYKVRFFWNRMFF